MVIGEFLDATVPLGEVVALARAGDGDASSELVRRFQDFAFGFAVRWTGDTMASVDVAQEAFATVFTQLDHLRDDEAFPGWFAAIVRTCAERHRRRQRPTRRLDEVDGVATTDVAADVVDRAVAQDVRAAIEALPAIERDVVALHYLAGLTYPEVATFLGVTTSAAKKRAHAARARMKETLMSAEPSLASVRPSASRRFGDTVRLFAAIARHDTNSVKQLLASNPDLVHASGSASWEQAAATGVGYGDLGTPLLRAVGTGDTDLVRVVLDAGGRVDATCPCDAQESALFVAAVRGDLELTVMLLDRGADPNAATARGLTPLHAAAQRGATDVMQHLIAAGADDTVRDAGGRTASDWLQLQRQRTRHGLCETFVTSGIRALDLFAPLRRGGRQWWPAAVGLGQYVTLVAIADALPTTRCLFLGFEYGPFTQQALIDEGREVDVDYDVRLIAGNDPSHRRATFTAALAELSWDRTDKLVYLVAAPGHEHDVVSALPELSANPTVMQTIVIQPFSGNYPAVGPAVPEGHDGQVAFDVERARRGLYPAIDGRTTLSTSYPSQRHADLAAQARTILAVPDDPRHHALQQWLCQPLRIAEPFTAEPGTDTDHQQLLNDVEHLLHASPAP